MFDEKVNEPITVCTGTGELFRDIDLVSATKKLYKKDSYFFVSLVLFVDCKEDFILVKVDMEDFWSARLPEVCLQDGTISYKGLG